MTRTTILNTQMTRSCDLLSLGSVSNVLHEEAAVGLVLNSWSIKCVCGIEQCGQIEG